MSRLRKQQPAHDVHYIRIQDVDTEQFQMIPVMHVMKDYDRVLANGETRPFVMSDFFFESGEPLPHVNVNLKDMAKRAGSFVTKAKKKGGKMASKAKDKAKEMASKAKEKAKEMKDKAKKAMADAKEAYKEGKKEAEEEASAQKTVTLKY